VITVASATSAAARPIPRYRVAVVFIVTPDFAADDWCHQ
jgi:hypothetical protein